ncbi:uncharacterized protein PITG_15704 [Phytophthora infestans T30-4]|uniref:Sepiapterin reductase n=1 Tax=Phytophthora infestans (strain T30-4) TaxID=403677 RepID=D0NSD4_PHYIT|nr:uncharacterized protein PITG_15704 [Phytophthora infestans T30-4]EEY64479.1 conserved hypothetical protein [Phytophthora infestans T30-4]|eukprot:XP_002897982.1 conserved hypothetical protein [Phytophthora infestans T30-4]
MARHFELNVTSVMWLNKRFLDSEVDYLQRVVESAIAPYSTLSQYCTAKAARKMHFRVLATEQAACNKVRVFSYAPGAMDTEMQQSMRESPLWAPELTHWFVKMKEEGTLIPIQQSSQRALSTETLSLGNMSPLNEQDVRLPIDELQVATGLGHVKVLINHVGLDKSSIR